MFTSPSALARRVLLCSATILTHVSAQTVDPMSEPLVTDRPDFTESTETIPAGHVQLESGYTFTLNDDDGLRTQNHTAPEGLLRVGLTENLELRLGWEGYAWTRDRTSATEDSDGETFRTDNANDATIGLKWKLFEQDGWRPHFGLIFETSVPSGNGDATTNDADPAVKLLWAYDLAEGFSLSGNVNLAIPTENGSRFLQTAASISLAVALDDRWGIYSEYYGFFNNAHHADAAHYLNGGVTFLVHNNLQLDWRAGFGLNDEADDFFTGVGFVIRF